MNMDSFERVMWSFFGALLMGLVLLFVHDPHRAQKQRIERLKLERAATALEAQIRIHEASYRNAGRGGF